MKKPKLHTAKELAEAHVFPSQLSATEKSKADKEFSDYRMQRFRQMTDEDRYYSRLLQLKYPMEDYLNNNSYIEKYTFGHFLKEYIHSLNKKNVDFSRDINVHVTKLSRLLNNKEEPNQRMFIKLEIHSDNSIPALFWYRILVKQKELEFINDKSIRKSENKNVTNRLKFR